MKIFLSWAGEGSASHQVARVLHDWLPNVIQSLRPWISSQDIHKGTRPTVELARELQEQSFGIVCVTKKSQAARWLNFEAGALSKQLDNSRVYPFLFRMRPSDVSGPLASFQMAIYSPDRNVSDELFSLLWAINSAGSDLLISETQLRNAFDVWWPKLQERLDAIPEDEDGKQDEHTSATARGSEPAIEEILRLIRDQQRAIRDLQRPHWTPEPGTIADIALRGARAFDVPVEVSSLHRDLPRRLGLVMTDESLSCEDKLAVIEAYVRKIEPFFLRTQHRSALPPDRGYRVIDTGQGKQIVLADDE